MPVPISEQGFEANISHHGTGYTGGFTVTHDHFVATTFLVIHTGMSQLQATTGGPVGAAIGIVGIGSTDLNNPSTWLTAFYGRISQFTVAAWVNKGDLRAWWFFQVWM